MFKKAARLFSLFAVLAVCASCATLGADSEPVETAMAAVDVANELCAIDLSKAPRVQAAAAKVPTEVLRYAREICKDAGLVAPYARLLGQGTDTGALISPLEEARQRALEKGVTSGVLSP